MVKESIKFAQNRWGFNVLEVIVPFPTDEAKVTLHNPTQPMLKISNMLLKIDFVVG